MAKWCGQIPETRTEVLEDFYLNLPRLFLPRHNEKFDLGELVYVTYASRTGSTCADFCSERCIFGRRVVEGMVLLMKKPASGIWAVENEVGVRVGQRSRKGRGRRPMCGMAGIHTSG